jgi:hypothetical protein
MFVFPNIFETFFNKKGAVENRPRAMNVRSRDQNEADLEGDMRDNPNRARRDVKVVLPIRSVMLLKFLLMT